jgi:hypothetical protein
MYSREPDADRKSGPSKEAYVAAFNFSGRRITLSGEAQVLLRGTIAASNTGRTEWEPSQTAALEAWEALLLQIPI